MKKSTYQSMIERIGLEATRAYFKEKAKARRDRLGEEYRDYRRSLYQKNKCHIQSTKRSWRANRTDDQRAKDKKYDQERRANNPEKVKTWMDNWRSKSADHCKQYYETNKKKILSKTTEWRRKNRVTLQAKDRKRYAEDIAYCMKRRLSARLRVAFNRAMVKKTANTMDLVGCDSDFLLSHIESKFLPGMTWANRSEWHIDHIKPCASFDLTQKDQQKACFHWSNLQPLWGADNCSKGDKITAP